MLHPLIIVDRIGEDPLEEPNNLMPYVAQVGYDHGDDDNGANDDNRDDDDDAAADNHDKNSSLRIHDFSPQTKCGAKFSPRKIYRRDMICVPYPNLKFHHQNVKKFLQNVHLSY